MGKKPLTPARRERRRASNKRWEEKNREKRCAWRDDNSETALPISGAGVQKNATNSDYSTARRRNRNRRRQSKRRDRPLYAPAGNEKPRLSGVMASPLAETRGEVSSTWRAVSIADSQMGGTTHAATDGTSWRRPRKPPKLSHWRRKIWNVIVTNEWRCCAPWAGHVIF
jgi:hypothetical protein